MTHLAVFVIAGVCLCALSSCDKKEDALSAIRREYAAGNYAETRALCEQALRDKISGGEVQFYYGLTLLSYGRDVEALESFGKAVESDTTLAASIANELVTRAREALVSGATGRAARLSKAAVDIMPAVKIGPLRYLVAAERLGQRDWDAALREYSRAIAEYPDTSAAERGYFNMAECYVLAGDSSAAIATLEKQLEKFPRGKLLSDGEWKLVNLLYNRGMTEFWRGDYDAAAGFARRMLGRSDKSVMVQKARFLLGESCERAGDFGGAYEQYSAIVNDEDAARGIVGRAQAKIRAFRDAGLLRR
jgi:tetratricopeptide (TPR) repeat protein